MISPAFLLTLPCMGDMDLFAIVLHPVLDYLCFKIRNYVQKMLFHRWI